MHSNIKPSQQDVGRRGREIDDLMPDREIDDLMPDLSGTEPSPLDQNLRSRQELTLLSDDLEAWEEQSNGAMKNLDKLLLSILLTGYSDALEGTTTGSQSEHDSLAMLDGELSALLVPSDTQSDAKEEKEAANKNAANDGAEWVPGSDGVEDTLAGSHKRRCKSGAGSKSSRLLRRRSSSTPWCRRALTPSVHRAGCAWFVHRIHSIWLSSAMSVSRMHSEWAWYMCRRESKRERARRSRVRKTEDIQRFQLRVDELKRNANTHNVELRRVSMDNAQLCERMHSQQQQHEASMQHVRHLGHSVKGCQCLN
jgi:hypothetical protein